MTPRSLLELGPLARDATPGQAAAHDQQTAEAAKTRQKTRLPLRRAPAVQQPAHRRRTHLLHHQRPPSNNITRGWTRLMGLTPLMLWLACLLTTRNRRILIAWTTRRHDNACRAAASLPPRSQPAAPHRAVGAAKPSPTWPPQAHHPDRPGRPER